MKMNKLLSASLAAMTFAAFASTANAACTSTTCSGEISRIFINQGGVLSIRLADTDIGDSSCTATNNYATLQPSNSGFKNFYAMALTAQVSKAPVSLRMVDNSPTCEIQYIVLDTPQ